ncbi:hypothetical protein NW764_016489 [Fusarium oxysporum]|nr:hypothetical protein NW764_016489 [Fusarium oxysporum]
MTRDQTTDWVNLHTKDVTWTDHAFQLWREGHAGVINHAKIWRGAIPEFKIEAKTIWQEESLPGGKTRIVCPTQNTGTFVSDLPAVKASGKAFWFPGVIDFVIQDEDGLIESMNEYYTFIFHGVNSINGYERKE